MRSNSDQLGIAKKWVGSTVQHLWFACKSTKPGGHCQLPQQITAVNAASNSRNGLVNSAEIRAPSCGSTCQPRMPCRQRDPKSGGSALRI